MSSPADSWILEIRSRLAEPPPRRRPPSDDRPAAVLVPLYVHADELWVLLTRRSDELPHHRGQIAFPGGGGEPGESAWDTALRETEEEIGIDGGRILRLGQLDESETPSGYRIVPCVGAIPHPVETTLNDEIDEVFPVPASALAAPRMVEERTVEIDGQQRSLRIYHVGGRQIWGLTARILENLLDRLGVAGTREEPAAP